MAHMPQDEEWRVLAEEAAQEKDPNKLMEIIRALTRALDEKDERKSGPYSDHLRDTTRTSKPLEKSNP